MGLPETVLAVCMHVHEQRLSSFFDGCLTSSPNNYHGRTWKYLQVYLLAASIFLQREVPTTSAVGKEKHPDLRQFFILSVQRVMQVFSCCRVHPGCRRTGTPSAKTFAEPKYSVRTVVAEPHTEDDQWPQYNSCPAQLLGILGFMTS